MTHKSKNLCSGWMQDIENGLEDRIQHNASIDSLVNEAIVQRKCIIPCEKFGASLFTYVTPNYETMFFAERGNLTHQYKTPSSCLPSEPLPTCSLAKAHYDVIQGVGVQLMRVIDYADFALKKFRGFNITLSYNVLQFTTIQVSFHTLGAHTLKG